MKLGIFKLVGKDCGNLAILLGNSSGSDLVTLAKQLIARFAKRNPLRVRDRLIE